MVYEAIVKRLKKNNAKATLPPLDEKKPYDLLQLLCKVHHNHTLCDMTLQLMQEDVVTKDFRNGDMTLQLMQEEVVTRDFRNGKLQTIIATVFPTAF